MLTWPHPPSLTSRPPDLPSPLDCSSAFPHLLLFVYILRTAPFFFWCFVQLNSELIRLDCAPRSFCQAQRSPRPLLLMASSIFVGSQILANHEMLFKKQFVIRPVLREIKRYSCDPAQVSSVCVCVHKSSYYPSSNTFSLSRLQ